uniref:Uncharacterized protein n=1 Tax=Anguilla anguilla TaxID=7936 RepID=A0A0E9W893_ANGAN
MPWLICHRKCVVTWNVRRCEELSLSIFSLGVCKLKSRLATKSFYTCTKEAIERTRLSRTL